MTLMEETLDLGYLECAFLKREQSPNHLSKAPVIEDVHACGSTLKFGGTLKPSETRTPKRTASEGYVEDEAPIQPLEWTHQPVREVRKEGNVRYHVSKAARPSQMDNKIHLIRTTRIEPRPRTSSPCSRPSSGQKSLSPPAEGSEEICVSEADFRRCGKRLTLLRGCKLPKMPACTEEVVKNELELSFKSAFIKRCQAQDEQVADPWKGYGHPDDYRPAYEGDLVLNQVWIQPTSPTTTEVDDVDVVDRSGSPCSPDRAPEKTMNPLSSARGARRDMTRASSVGAVTRSAPLQSFRGRGEQVEQQETRSQSRKSSRHLASHRGNRRCRSVSTLSPEQTTPSLAFGGEETQSRRSRHASGLPRPSSGRESSVKAKPKEYVNRIQEREPDSDEETTQRYRGSVAVQQAQRTEKRFSYALDWRAEENVKVQALWLSLHSLTGEVSIYPRAAATRLESAYVNNRLNVPMAGLGGNLEDSIVHMAKKGSNEHPLQISEKGWEMDVRRFQMRTDADEICVNVAYDNGWHIVDVPVPGETEQRFVILRGTETVRPPTPPLPPLNPDRRCSVSCIKPWWE